MSDMPDDTGEAIEADEPAKPAKIAKPPKAPKPKKEKTKGKGFNAVLVLVPIALVAAAVLAFMLPPTHAMLANGPLKPIFARLPQAGGKLAGAQPQKSADPVADVKRFNDTVESDRKAIAAKDARIAQLQSQVTQLQTQPSPAPTAQPASKPTPAVVSDAVKRVATYWAGMDADKAADIVKQLPDAYVKLVFSQMPADAVSDIMSALPAKTAARLTASAGSDAL